MRCARFTLGVLLTLCLNSPVPASDPTPETLIRAGHWKRARALVEQRYRANPGDASSAYLLSEVKSTFGDLDAALDLAEKAVAADGKNADYHFQLAVVCGRTAEKASLFSKSGWAHRFKEEAEKAAALDPRSLDPRFALMEFYLQAPRLMGGSRHKASTMAEEIGRIDPARGYLAQARLAEDAKDSALEEADYRKAVEMSPLDYEVLISAAESCWKTARKVDFVEKCAQQAVALDRTQVRGYSLLATVYAAEQHWKELESILAEAERNVHDDLDPYYQAGRVLLVEGEGPARAERYFRKYLTQEPEADEPTLAHAHWQLGLALEKQGHKSDALSEIETAVRLKPDLREAKKDLARLK